MVDLKQAGPIAKGERLEYPGTTEKKEGFTKKFEGIFTSEALFLMFAHAERDPTVRKNVESAIERVNEMGLPAFRKVCAAFGEDITGQYDLAGRYVDALDITQRGGVEKFIDALGRFEGLVGRENIVKASQDDGLSGIIFCVYYPAEYGIDRMTKIFRILGEETVLDFFTKDPINFSFIIRQLYLQTSLDEFERAYSEMTEESKGLFLWNLAHASDVESRQMMKGRGKFAYGWLSPSRFIRPEELSGIFDKDGEQAVDERIVRLVRDEKNLEVILERAKDDPVFSPRLKVLKDVLDAHRERKFTISVPMCYILIDGAVAQIAENAGIEPRSKKTMAGAIYYFVARDGREIRSFDFGNLIREFNGEKKLFPEELADFLLNDVYVDRNKIVHGKDLNYDEEIRSARLILVIQEIINANRPRLPEPSP